MRTSRAGVALGPTRGARATMSELGGPRRASWTSSDPTRVRPRRGTSPAWETSRPQHSSWRASASIALYHRARTGRGQLVDACLLRSAMYVQGCSLAMSSAAQAKTGSKGYNPDRPSPMRADRTGVVNPANNNYRTKDGKYIQLVGVEMMRHLPGILQALGIPHLLKEMKGFPGNKDMFIAEMDKAFATKTEAEWTQLFDNAGVWHARVRKLEDMLHDEQANACRSFVEVPGVASKLLASPVLFGAGVDDVPTRRAPALGAHTDEVLGPLRAKL
ncbi:unnamed protein product [Prorocentrum cordatum]|uniref:Uncharacterized protein n=1 Tax=Prorocentrum cordatum TaxID=2364126 RepID=A0ABN9YA61_9DINO|nr:unnamed protein product [Polarella glacialis]